MTTTALPRPSARLLPPREKGLRREFRLLAEVAYDEKANISELLSDPALDWDYLLAAAKFHGLIPVLAPRLLRQITSVPERVRFEVQQASRRALEGTLALSGELVRVLRNLKLRMWNAFHSRDQRSLRNCGKTSRCGSRWTSICWFGPCTSGRRLKFCGDTVHARV